MATYDPKRNNVTLGASLILGYASGTMVEIERNADAIGLLVGTQGEYAWAINRDRSGLITLYLMHTAQSNDVLEAMAAEDEAFGTGGRPFMLEDLNGRTLAFSPEVHVLKRPNIVRSNEITTNEWQLLAGDLDLRHGGNLVP